MKQNSVPLAQELVTKIIEELDALVACPENGWDKKYINLFGMLSSLVDEFCNKLNSQKPDIFINFHGIQNHQAAAYLMTDGKAQLHIGAALIKKTFSWQNHKDQMAAYQAFRWIIAHELGHMSDPVFQKFARSFNLRTIVDNIARLWVGMGIMQVCWQFASPTLVPSFWSTWYLLGFGISVMAIKKATLVLLHRRFEYTADALSAKIMDNFSPSVAQQALCSIHEAIQHEIDASITSSNKIIQTIRRKMMLLRIYHLHPSLSRRIARLLVAR